MAFRPILRQRQFRLAVEVTAVTERQAVAAARSVTIPGMAIGEHQLEESAVQVRTDLPEAAVSFLYIIKGRLRCHTHSLKQAHR